VTRQEQLKRCSMPSGGTGTGVKAQVWRVVFQLASASGRPQSIVSALVDVMRAGATGPRKIKDCGWLREWAKPR
jgi:hypothetical protein